MNRMLRAMLAVFFVVVAAVSVITIAAALGRGRRVDITQRRLYTLSDGTKKILAGITQPITVKLFYTKTAAMKAPDQIRYYNNYYYYVRALLEEYTGQAGGMIKLEVIDPRPYTAEELAAIRYGLKRFNITQEEGFFFGLVVQTQFGVTKTIDFFAPDRQAFVEYDISYLIDTAMNRQKKRIGILSSLPVVGDEASGYMAAMMRMQGQQPRPAWTIVQHLRQSYEVSSVPADADKIENVDILLVIHPKLLPEKTVFAIDQFILNGGRAMLLLDPHCVADDSARTQAQYDGQMPSSASNLPALLKAWGLEMPEMTFAGDRDLAVVGSTAPNRRPGAILGILGLNSAAGCFGKDTPITAYLNKVNIMFPGVLKKLDAGGKPVSDIRYAPLLKTSPKGNSWTVASPYELMDPDYEEFLRRFQDGTEPVVMAYQISGKLPSVFPNGIDIPDPNTAGDSQNKKDDKAKSAQKKIHITGLTEAKEDVSVVVFADVDFISDVVAYYRNPLFGTIIVADNSSLMFNVLEDMAGSSYLMAVRSRGSYTRPFERVDQIEKQAEAETAEEETKIVAQIKGFEQDLNQKLASLEKDQGGLINKTILDEKSKIEVKLRQAESRLRNVKMQKVQRIEKLGVRLKNFCTLPGPALILAIAVILSVFRAVRRRHYISHASDA